MANANNNVTSNLIKQRFSRSVTAPALDEIEAQNLQEVQNAIQVSGNPNQKPLIETRSVYDLEPGKYQKLLRNMQQVENPDTEAFQSLLTSIQANGFIGELLISKNDRIYSGHRRWAVLKWLHENENWSEYVPVAIVDIPGMDELSFMTKFNSTSEQLTKEAKASIVNEYYNKQGLSIREVASKTGFKKNEVEQALEIAQLPIEIQKAIDEKKITVKDAVATLHTATATSVLQPATQLTPTVSTMAFPATKDLPLEPNDVEGSNDIVGPEINHKPKFSPEIVASVSNPVIQPVAVEQVQVQVGDIQIRKIIKQLSKAEADLDRLEGPIDSKLVNELQGVLNRIQFKSTELA